MLNLKKRVWWGIDRIPVEVDQRTCLELQIMLVLDRKDGDLVTVSHVLPPNFHNSVLRAENTNSEMR